jgi:REP element-mobilizing transposase RayT
LHKHEQSGTGVSPVKALGQDAHATKTSQIHGQDAHATLRIRRGAYLPHWTRERAVYSVNFRLADSLPSSVIKTWEFERDDIVKTARQMNRALTASEEKRLDVLFSERVEKYLDKGRGACWMREDEVAAIVQNVLQKFDDVRYRLHAWCIMPNHVHAILRPHPDLELPDILHSWKSFSSKQANRALGRTGKFWQPEYYDHLIRDEDDFARQVEYVLSNPSAAGLEKWKWVGSGTGVSRVKDHGQDAHATENQSAGAPVDRDGQRR